VSVGKKQGLQRESMHGASYATAQPVYSDVTDGTSVDSDLLPYGYDVPVATPVTSGDGGVTQAGPLPHAPQPSLQVTSRPAGIPHNIKMAWANKQHPLPMGVLYAPQSHTGPLVAYCYCCQQGLKTSQSLQQHLAGKKHQGNAAKRPIFWPPNTFTGFDSDIDSPSGVVGGPGTPAPSAAGMLGNCVLGLPAACCH
jgi:hypothetical protein